MTGKMRLYIGLLVLGLLLIGGGLWFLFNLPPEIEIPESMPVITMELDFVMRGEFGKLYLYENGVVLYVEESGLRLPTPEHPPTRAWKVGNVSKEALSSLIQLFQTDEFTGLDEYYQFPGKEIESPGGITGTTIGDISCTLYIDYGDLRKKVTAFGYLTPDHGITYPDMPYPLNEIYKRLRVIIDDKIQEVYRESI